jgi:serine/threonine protein kinase
MAPEQYRGQVSPASDVYGTGALLHYLLTRSDPRQEVPFTWAERPIKRFNPHVPDNFSAIVNKALEFSPEDRYPDSAAMLTALRALRS